LLGAIFQNQINQYFETNYYFKYLQILLILFLLFLSITFFCISLDFKFKNFYILVKIILKASSFIFRPIISLNSKIQFSKQRNNSKIKPIHGKIYKKIEPTIIKTNLKNKFDKDLNQANNNELNSKYILPPTNLLKISNEKKNSLREVEQRNSVLSQKLEETLEEYGVDGRVVNYKTGPVVTLFEFVPAAGVKTSKIVGLSDDIARAMSSISTRIAPQPGKISLGIEIPNQKREDVLLGDLISNEDFFKSDNGLTLALGKNISGEKKYTDLEKMPHLLIAGTTGSGKSVGINSMIVSLLFRFTPSECKLILIDPKMLELSVYADIPHLLTPVVTNPNKAVFALKWVVREMENRYKLMSSLNVKNINSYNNKILNAKSSGRKLYREVQTGIDKETRNPIIEKKEIVLEKMPLIVVVIDEMADLMMVAGKEVENLVQRLAQMARASGIHIIAATQRPSVDVITGTIKANFPSRISFRVASRFDSRTILNEMGAEQLLGSGDMLFLENGANLNRLHGGFISEKEIESIVNHIKSQGSNEVQEDITKENEFQKNDELNFGFSDKNVDELYGKAIEIILEQQKVSTSFIQRYLQIGYNRAARIVEKMEEDGYITEPNHSGKRSVIKKNK
jgi:S-DNA-T family DNA segregation ATPase FtsK/SpoIIIE